MLRLLKAHGWNSTSFQVLGPRFRYAFDEQGGCVAFFDTGAAWVAAGAPITSAASLQSVAEQFVERASAAERRVCFFAVEERFVARVPLERLKIGEQPVYDPGAWQGAVRRSASLRQQLRRARNKGVTVRPVSPNELSPGLPLRGEVERLIQRWLSARPLSPMGFLVDVRPFRFLQERVYFLAVQNGEPAGLLVLAPIYQREGWLVEHFIRDPLAPNGTVEALIDGGMAFMAEAGCHYATLGLAPLSGEIPRPLRLARELTRGLYDFQGLRAFKAKLAPVGWDDIYVAYPAAQGPVLTFWDVLCAFSGLDMLRFGVRTLGKHAVSWGRGRSLPGGQRGSVAVNARLAR